MSKNNQEVKIKWHFKNYNYFIILLFLSVLVSLYLVINRLNIVFKNYASIETEKFIKGLINTTINNEFLDEFEKKYGVFFTETRDKNNDIVTVDINRQVVNKFLNTTIVNIENNLIAVENGSISNIELPKNIGSSKFKRIKQGVIMDIPSGLIFGNSFFSDVGPKIPVKVNLLGNVVGDIDVRVRDYGINNTLIEIYIKVNIEEKIILPMTFKKINIKYDILVDSKLIHGKIPNYYLNSDMYTK